MSQNSKKQVPPTFRTSTTTTLYDVEVDVEFDIDEIVDFLEEQGYTVLPPDKVVEGDLKELLIEAFEQYRNKGTITDQTLSKMFDTGLGRIV